MYFDQSRARGPLNGPLTIRSKNHYHHAMEKEKPKIRVQDVQTGQTLLECSIAESERAYEVAAQMEEMGLDVRVAAPTLNDTLSSSLGLSHEEKAQLEQSLEEEMESHESSCCFEDPACRLKN